MLSLRVTHHFADPIQELAVEAAEIGKGRLDRRIDVKAGGEVGMLAETFNEMVTSLREHIEELRRATAAKERLDTEMRVAADVQRDMLPKEIPAPPGVEISAYTRPAYAVGGDFYDLIELPAGGVDTILMVDTLHYITQRTAYAEKLRAGLAPGGRVVIIDYKPKPFEERPWGPPPEQQISRETVDADFAKAGLQPVKVHDFLPEQYFVEYRAE